MRKPKKQENNHALRPLFLLILFVLVLLTISFLYRLSTVLKTSKFDGENRFTILIKTQKDSSAKIHQLGFLSLDPQSKTASILRLKKMPLEKSSNLELGLPIDAVIVSSHTLDEKNISHFLITLISDPRVHTDLTIVDMIRLLAVSYSISGNSVQNVSIDKADETTKNQTEDLFLDQEILKENVSIQLINASGVSGIGALFSRIISSQGGNVVSVTTSDSIQKTSQIIYYGNIGYTIQKLEKLFHFPIGEMKKEGIADIIVIIGKDYNKFTF